MENKIEEKKPIKPEEIKPDTTMSMIERAEAAVKAMVAANEESKLILDRAEKLRTQEILGGKSEAGQAPEVKKEETPQEYAKRVMSGEMAVEGI